MIYLFYGSDLGRAKTSATKLAKSLLAKKPEASFVSVDGENFNQSIFDELLFAQGLFENKAVILAKDLSSNKTANNFIEENIKNIANSANIFIFAEPEGDLAKKLLKKAEKGTEYLIKETIQKERFNVFLLTDAFARKNKKEAWILYINALRKGITPDEIEPMLFWQIKNMLLVKDYEKDQTRGLKETNLKPFVFSKSVSLAKNWQKEELESSLSNLLYLQREARSGEGDLDISIEKFILSV